MSIDLRNEPLPVLHATRARAPRPLRPSRRARTARGSGPAPVTRRWRRLRALLPAERPPFIATFEWEAARQWVRDCRPLTQVAASLGMSVWPLRRRLDRMLGQL